MLSPMYIMVSYVLNNLHLSFLECLIMNKLSFDNLSSLSTSAQQSP